MALHFVGILWCSGKLECPCKIFLHLGNLLEVKRLLEPADVCYFVSIASKVIDARRLASKDLSQLTIALPIDEHDRGVGQGRTTGGDFQGEVDISQVSTYSTCQRKSHPWVISLTKERYSGGLGTVQQSPIRREVVVAIEHALHFCADLLVLRCQELRRTRQSYILG